MGIEISAPKEFYVAYQSAEYFQLNNRPEGYRDDDMMYYDQIKIEFWSSKDKYAENNFNEIDFCKEVDRRSTVISCQNIKINEYPFNKAVYASFMSGQNVIDLKTINKTIFINIVGSDQSHPTNSKYNAGEVEAILNNIFSTIKIK